MAKRKDIEAKTDQQRHHERGSPLCLGEDNAKHTQPFFTLFIPCIVGNQPRQYSVQQNALYCFHIFYITIYCSSIDTDPCKEQSQ
jgi:hypothetical protein